MEFNSGQFQFPQNDTRNEIKFSHRRCFSPVLSLSTATTTIGGIIKQAQPPTATGAVVLGWSVMRHTQLASYSSPHPLPLPLVYVFIAVDEEVGGRTGGRDERTMPIFILHHSLRRGGLVWSTTRQ